jgi:hypothetical protein
MEAFSPENEESGILASNFSFKKKAHKIVRDCYNSLERQLQVFPKV